MQQQTPMAIKIHTHKSKPLSVVVVCSPKVLYPSSPLDDLHAVVVVSLQPKADRS